MNKKIEPTKEDLKKIQEMIYENKFYEEIAREFPWSAKTIKRMIKDSDLDVSKYNPVHNREGTRAFKPTQEQLEYIQVQINKGQGKGAIASSLGITRGTLNAVIEKHDIDMTHYLRPSGRKKILSQKEIDSLRRMLDGGMMYRDIATQMGINRNLVSELIKRYGLTGHGHNNFSKPLNDQELEALKEIAAKGLTAAKIAKCFDRGTGFIRKTLDQQGITVAPDGQGKADTKTLIECVALAAEAAGSLPSRSQLSADDMKRLPELLKEMPFEEVCDYLEKSSVAVRKAISLCDLNELLWPDAIKSYPFGVQFDEDMMNPMLSSTFLSAKYGPSNCTIGKWRREFYNTNSGLGNNFYSKTTAEMAFEEILKDLDLAYIYRKKIIGYEVDFYLGQRVIVEVQGNYWHTLTRNKQGKTSQQSDFEKKIALENAGYEVLPIWEKEIKESPEKVAETVISTYLSHLTNK